MTVTEPDTSAVRAALDVLVDALTNDNSTGGQAAHLQRVRAADRARGMLIEVAEEALDDAILTARATQPEGATWAQLGEILGITGQAVSKRAGVRSLSRRRQQLSPTQRAERSALRYAAAVAAYQRSGKSGW